MRRNHLVLAQIMLAGACGEPPELRPDAGLPLEIADAETDDEIAFREPDAGTAVGQQTCAPCEPECPNGSCVQAGNGPPYCAGSCQDKLDQCLTGFSCVDISADAEPLQVCIPPLGNCDDPALGFGTPCYGDTDACHQSLNHCQGDRYRVGYCTQSCAQGACPPGLQCALGDNGDFVCQLQDLAAPQRCGQESRNDEILCIDRFACPSPRVCFGLTETSPGVCAMPSAARCPEQSSARWHRGERFCVPERCSCLGDIGAAPDLMSQALAEIGLDRCTLLFSAHDLSTIGSSIRNDDYRRAFFDPLHREANAAPRWSSALLRNIESTLAPDTPTSVAVQAIETFAELLDAPMTSIPPGSVDPERPLRAAIVQLIENHGGIADHELIEAQSMEIEPELSFALALIIDGIDRAATARKDALRQISPNVRQQLFTYGHGFIAPTLDGRGLNPAAEAVAELLISSIDHGAMYAGATALLVSIETAQIDSISTSRQDVLLDVDTPLGKIVVGGNGDDNWLETEEHYALLLDLGGNDTYLTAAGGNASVQNGVSVLIDLAGRDSYAYPEAPHALDADRMVSDDSGRNPAGQTLSDTARQGGGRLGIGILVDLGDSDDSYRALRFGQGAGIFGVGVLIDQGGNDHYQAENVAQGAGVFGIGLHIDHAGNDERSAYQSAQGFGFAMSAGFCFDSAGNDIYRLDVGDPQAGGDPLYPAAQRPERSNASLGQGVGFGRRDDISLAHMSGGLGILRDRSGDDRYTASIFAQGAGFWFGTGILSDAEGNDQYDGLWYTQGAAAHFSVGALFDGSGDDRYGTLIPPINVTLGAAHDMSVAWLVDGAGQDTYRGQRLTLGTGNTNGIGIFVDQRGDDRYSIATSYGLGGAGLLENGLSEPGAARRRVDTVGIFIDAQGNDVYSGPGRGADSTSWRGEQSDDGRGERGIGIDANGEVQLQ